MTESLEIQKAKIDSLVTGFTNSGYKSGNRMGQTEFIQFLDHRSSSGKFDPIISGKLFQVIGLDAMSTITVQEFINGFLQFEEELRKNAETFSMKLAREEEIYAQVNADFKKYKEEHLNAEGLCEKSKVSGEITEIDIKKKLEGIKEIIIKVVFNEKSEEFHFKIGDINSNELEHKTFEFKPTSRKDHFEFIMKGVNERNQIFDIGSKVFPLNDVGSAEEYLVQIVVPEIDNEEQIAAHIKAKIVLYWNDYKYYEKLKRKAESKLKKLTIAKNKADEYLRKVREIYGDLTRKMPDLIVDFNNEKLMQKKGAKLNVDFNNIKEAEAPGGNFLVEFNNQKEVLIQQTEEKVEEKEEEKQEFPVIETVFEEINKNDNNNIDLNPEEYQNAFGNEPINIEQYGTTETNYEEYNKTYNTTNYEPVQETVTDIQSTEIVNETEIRNSINDAVIRQSLNKPLISENTLPVIRKEIVNKVIYDSNVKTLPLIFGGKKVTYLSDEEAKNYDFSGLMGQATTQEIQGGEDYSSLIQGQTENYTQEIQGSEDYSSLIQGETQINTQEIQGGEDYTSLIQGQTENYTQEIQGGEDYTSLIQGQTETYTQQDTSHGQQDYSSLIQGNTETTVQTTQTVIENTPSIQVQDYSQISPIQDSVYGEYPTTTY